MNTATKRFRNVRNISLVQPPLSSVAMVTLGMTALGTIIAIMTKNVLTMNQASGGRGEGPQDDEPDSALGGHDLHQVEGAGEQDDPHHGEEQGDLVGHHLVKGS